MEEQTLSIHVLDKKTVDQIAAGEVVERPSSVVKELAENAIDAGADAVTVEIRNGGIDMIRVTDNGSGIPADEIATAFLSHATSKIEDADDLFSIASLGFRGEALPSIAAVTELEVISKTKNAVTGISYEIHGGKEIGKTEIGAPDGTTFLVNNIFYNTPVRRKFLKTAMTEASYIENIIEKLALSHPGVSFRFINNGSTRLSTSGNGKVKDLIYSLFGRETANELLPVDFKDTMLSISGFIGKPVLLKGNRGYENYFINGRFVRSNVITKAIEDAYQPFMMQHRYPFTVLYIEMDPAFFDVNVHPTKMELRFQQEPYVYDVVKRAVHETLSHKEFIPDVSLDDEKSGKSVKEAAPKTEAAYRAPEPFETKRIREEGRYSVAEKKEEIRPKTPEVGSVPDKEKTEISIKKTEAPRLEASKVDVIPESRGAGTTAKIEKPERSGSIIEPQEKQEKAVQEDLFKDHFLSEEGIRKQRLIGQLFDTYWLIEMEDSLYIMDQHAAHEKVLYERKMKELAERRQTSQNISPPIMVTLSPKEEIMLNRYMTYFSELGYEVSSFGGREYAISAVPADIYGLDVKRLFEDILSEMSEEVNTRSTELIRAKIASASCKAAVKGNHTMTKEEAEHLIGELLTLDNPYACPHGRPTIITLNKNEIEKKFKRIV